MNPVKRLQQFVSQKTGQKIRVTNVVKSSDSIKHDLCTVVNVLPTGLADKKTQRVIKADSIRRHYVKFNP